MFRRFFIFITISYLLLTGWREEIRAQSSDPRVVAAQAEMQSLADAEDACAIDTNFYVSLETLNDTSILNAQKPYDFLNNEGGTWVISPTKGIFESNRRNLFGGTNHWNGPYVNFQQGKTQTGLSPYDQGSPLDPWGNPYYFFTPAGMVRGDEGAITLEQYGDFFDRYTIVSLGFDAIKSADDVIYQFGTGVTTFAVTSVRLSGKDASGNSIPIEKSAKSATEKKMPANTVLSGGTFRVFNGSTIIVRGLNFGATQSGAQVRWGTTNGTTTLTNIQSWSNREIKLQLPKTLRGSGSLKVVRGAATSLGATLEILGNAAGNWQFYQ